MTIKSTVAQCAALIRNELKKSFPRTKFKVKSYKYPADSFFLPSGDAVSVCWTDGAAKNQVKKILEKYQYYQYTDDRYDIAQTKYLYFERKVSDEI